MLMGFMRNVPFFWSLRLIPIMVLNVVILLVIFYILDSRAYRKDLAEGIVPEVAKGEKEAIRVVGAHNIIFLAAIVVAVILSGILPSTKVFGGGIHIFGEVKLTYAAIIEVVIILAAAFLSFKTTNKSVREDNHFSWGAIQEVAVLFIWYFYYDDPSTSDFESKRCRAWSDRTVADVLGNRCHVQFSG